MPRLPWPAEHRPIWRRFVSIVRFAAGATLVGLIVAIMVGFVVQRIAVRRDAVEVPPTGSIVDAAGQKLHAVVAGQGEPTVVFDSGLGGTSLDWTGVAPAVAKHARVVTYDRAGMGWSPPASTPRNAAQIATELHGLLGELGITGPIVLVGHSLGGYHIRMFQSMYPDRVAGMVFVDCSHEDQWEKLPTRDSVLLSAYPWILQGMHWASKVGGTRLFVWGAGDRLTADTKAPADAQRAMASFFARGDMFLASQGEYAAIPDSCRQLKESRKPLGDLPIVVLTGMEDKKDEMATVWLELQADMATLSTRSRHQILDDAGHYVQSKRPDAVVDAILEVLEKARNPAPGWAPADASTDWAPSGPASVIRVDSIWG